MKLLLFACLVSLACAQYNLEMLMDEPRSPIPEVVELPMVRAIRENPKSIKFATSGSLTCNAMSGGTCTGATACFARYKRKTDGTTVLNAQGCISQNPTSAPANNQPFFQWTEKFLIIVCTTNQCNTATPPATAPTQPSFTQPPQLRCNNMGGGTCMGTVCYQGQETQQGLGTVNFPQCLHGAQAAQLNQIPNFCIQTVKQRSSVIPKLTFTNCTCTTGNLCNTPSLITSQMSTITSHQNVQCAIYVRSASNVNTAMAQYCQKIHTTYPNAYATDYLRAVTTSFSTAGPPPGTNSLCQRFYGFQANSVYKRYDCNGSAKCNVAIPAGQDC